MLKNSPGTDFIIGIICILAIIAACGASHKSGYWQGYKSGYQNKCKISKTI